MTLPSIEHQTSWLFSEMGTGDGGNIAGTYRNSPNMSVSDATIAFEQQYERSADTVGSSGMNQRIANANSVYRSYQNGTLSTQPSNVQYVFNQALDRGYTPEQAAGIVGNLQRESGTNLDPNARNPGDGTDGSDSVGIAQWNSSRAENMLNYDPATGEIVPNTEVQEGDIGSNGEPLTEEEAAEIREEARAREAVRRGGSYYEPNQLNDLESYTYNWAIHIVHPRTTVLPASEIIQNSNQFITIAQSGVENEISIERVSQQNALTFDKENRSAVANTFAIDLTEPAGFTLYNRLLYASQQLGIEQFLQACYILELNIRGWRNGQAVTVGPYYYTCKTDRMPMQYRDGASSYSFTLYETTQVAFNRLEFHLLEDIPRIQASNYGDFLSQFQDIVNQQAREQVINSPGQMYPNVYEFTTDGEFASWKFDAAIAEDLLGTRAISVTGTDEQLEFSISQGTSLTAAMAMALFHTRKFRMVMTRAGFALDQPEDQEASPERLTDLTQWVTFDTNVQFGAYDILIQEYQKFISYHSKPYIAPEIIHDPMSFDKLRYNPRLQRRRLLNLFDTGLLRKRYDYIYTGLNTEVLNIDLTFNNAFYHIQSLNSGASRFAGSAWNGNGLELEQLIDDLKQDLSGVRQRVASLRGQISQTQAEIEDLTRFGGGRFQDDVIQRREQIADFERQIEEAESEIRSLESTTDERLRELTAQTENLRRDVSSLPGANNRYITQSEVTSSGASRIPPNTFRYFYVESLSTQGPEHGIATTPIGAAKLGAIEMNLNSLADLLQIELEIRGDPYWLGASSEFDNGGPCLFLNLNFPTYPDEQSGLMENVGDFSISGVYRVTRVTNLYQDGQWIQILMCHLDTNTNYQLLRQELLEGYVQDTFNSSGIRTPQVDTDGDGIISEEEVAAAAANDQRLDPNAIGNDQPGGHTFDPGLDADLANLLADSADATGVTIGNRSGVRPYDPATGTDTAGSTSGRHFYGRAMDAELYSNGRLLSVNNAADRAIIQNFTQDFIDRSRAAGYQPSVGWADHNDPGNLYMGGTAGHFDIAAGQSNPARGNIIQPGYWGNGSSSSGAPAWLRNMYNS